MHVLQLGLGGCAGALQFFNETDKLTAVSEAHILLVADHVGQDLILLGERLLVRDLRLGLAEQPAIAQNKIRVLRSIVDQGVKWIPNYGLRVLLLVLSQKECRRSSPEVSLTELELLDALKFFAALHSTSAFSAKWSLRKNSIGSVRV